MPTVASLSAVEQAALAGAPDGIRLAVVLSPPGRRGCRSRCSSPAGATPCTGCLRPRRPIYAGSCAGTRRPDGAGAETLARLPLAGPRGLQPLELPGAQAAGLDRRVRACDPLTKDAATHKVRIKDLVRQLLPMTPLAGDLGTADLAVLERYAGPDKLAAAGETGLARLIATASSQQQGHARAREWLAVATAARDVYGDHPAVTFGELAAEVATGVRLLKDVQAGLASHATAREKRYKKVDPRQLARSLPGFAQISAPVLVAAMGRPGRFPDGARFKSFRARAAGLPDRRNRPQRPADEQGRPVAAARHLRPGR